MSDFLTPETSPALIATAGLPVGSAPDSTPPHRPTMQPGAPGGVTGASPGRAWWDEPDAAALDDFMGNLARLPDSLGTSPGEGAAATNGVPATAPGTASGPVLGVPVGMKPPIVVGQPAPGVPVVWGGATGGTPPAASVGSAASAGGWLPVRPPGKAARPLRRRAARPQRRRRPPRRRKLRRRGRSSD